jgi:CheY-like chemotaxis protein
MSTILVVEDEPNVRKLVTVNLVQRGYRVLEAENGKQTWEHLHHQTPDLLVLDIKLPDLTGWDILDGLETIPDMPKDIPVIVMTATPVDQNQMLQKYPCIVEILIKPFNTAKLITIIQNTIPKN